MPADDGRVENESDRRTALLATSSAEIAQRVTQQLARYSVTTTIVSDGRAVIKRLSEQSISRAGVPSVVVLDRNLAGLHVETILDAIKSSPRLGAVPVVVLTEDADRESDETSGDADREADETSGDADREADETIRESERRAYALGANAHVVIGSQSDMIGDESESMEGESEATRGESAVNDDVIDSLAAFWFEWASLPPK
jgi:CheY-like chemotaxis protein